MMQHSHKIILLYNNKTRHVKGLTKDTYNEIAYLNLIYSNYIVP
jgi:hypothetical protein